MKVYKGTTLVRIDILYWSSILGKMM